MLNKITEGHALPFANTAAVVSGQAVKIGVLIGVAATSGAANETVAYAISGVYSLPKLSTDVVAAGDQLYWDDTAKRLTVVVTGNTKAGRAYAAAGNGASNVQLILNSNG